MKKLKWKTPKLEVLSRVTPEEFVLSACKRAAAGSVGSNDIGSGGCGMTATNCQACQPRGGS